MKKEQATRNVGNSALTIAADVKTLLPGRLNYDTII